MLLKTEVMAAEKSVLPSKDKKKWKRFNLKCNNISQYYCFYCILNILKLNAALVSIRHFFQKH